MKRLIIWLSIILVLTIFSLVFFRTLTWLREADVANDIAPESGTYISIEGHKVYTNQAPFPNEQAILFLHGTGAWSGLWSETFEALQSDRLQTIGLDMPPFGFSDRDPAGDYSRTRQAQRILHIAKIFERTSNIKPILVAHSFGAAAGMEAILIDPNAFAGLVLIDGAIGVGSHKTGARTLPFPLSNKIFAELIISSTATNPWMTKFLLKQMLHRKDRALQKYVDILHKPMTLKGSTSAFVDWLPSLLVVEPSALSIYKGNYQALNIPTVIIWGEEDTITPLEQGIELQSLIAGSSLEIMSNVGHIPQIEDPNAFQDILRRVLRDMIR